MSSLCFNTTFAALTDHQPLPWQVRLFNRFLEGDIPSACDLPTGLGKTAVIPIWLIALAETSSAPQLPRRLIYIVNRRTVVDQATDIAKQLYERLSTAEQLQDDAVRENLFRMRQALGRLCALSSDILVAISTLRGELADNQEWKTDPARPAMIIGTIDMIGSKLLFSGYGDGRYGRTHHAGLTGQDALIVLDEVHLTPAFAELLSSVAKEQQKLEGDRAIQVLELSATARRSDYNAITLTPEDESNEIVQTRLNAKKQLAFHEADVKQLCRQIAELAARYESVKARVLIYVRSPEDAQKVEQELRKRFDKPVALLTGTLRGYERDLLVRENAVYRALLDHNSRIKESVYLVSTSAGEVGIDLDADHMVCDLTTLDSMIQRLGRVNRRGGRSARVDVVIATSAESKQDVSPHTEALAATRTLLARLQENSDGSYDVSPQAVGALLREISEKEKLQAFQPHPPAVLPTDILLDAWALTSIRKSLPGRPEVAPYLHGLTDEEPETFVAWRHEVSLLDQPNLSREALRQWFRACKIKSHELLRDRTDRVLKELKKIVARRHGEHIPVVVLTERGDAECFSLADLVRKVQSEEKTLAFRTVVLPVEAGGLTDKGFLDGAWKEPASDVAEREPENARQPSYRRRIRLQIIEGEFWQRPFGEAETSTEEETIKRGECTSPYNAAMKLAQTSHGGLPNNPDKRAG